MRQVLIPFQIIRRFLREKSADALIADFDADWSWKDAAVFDVELNDPEWNIRQPASQIYLTV